MPKRKQVYSPITRKTMANITPAQKELFEELHNSRMEDFKTFNKKSYRGVWSGIIDKYPESAHFVYELLQNADDAEATEVNIILKPEMMICLLYTSPSPRD